MVQVERFASKVCGTGKVTYEEYILFYRALSHNGKRLEIRMEEYQREEDLEGKGYYSLVSNKELGAVLCEEKAYYFAKDSIVKIIVRCCNRSHESQILRFGRIDKGAVNGT